MLPEAHWVARVRRYYDVLGEDEWARLTNNVRGRSACKCIAGFCGASWLPTHGCSRSVQDPAG